MGGACSKKNKQENGPSESLQTFNVNESASKTSMWKHRIQGDNEQRNVRFGNNPDNSDPEPNDEDENRSMKRSRRNSVSENPNAPSSLKSRTPVSSQRDPDEDSPPTPDSPASSRPPSGRSGPPTPTSSKPASKMSSKPSTRMPMPVVENNTSKNSSTQDSSVEPSNKSSRVRRKSLKKHLKKSKSRSGRSSLLPSKTPSRTPSKERSKNSSKTPSKTRSKARSKTPSKTPSKNSKTGSIKSLEDEKSKNLEPQLSDTRLDLDPMRQGPTVIELGNPPRTRRSSHRTKSGHTTPSRPTTPQDTSSRVPGHRMKNRMMARLRSLRGGSRSRSRSVSKSPSTVKPSASNSNRRGSRRMSRSRKSISRPRSGRIVSSMPSHRVGKSRSRSQKASRGTSRVVLHEESFTTFQSGKRRPRNHAKDLISRADSLLDPYWIAKVEFENKNRKVLRSIWRDYEENNGLDECDDDCNCLKTKGTHSSLQLSNEVLDRILDSMCLKTNTSSIPGCSYSPRTRVCDVKRTDNSC